MAEFEKLDFWNQWKQKCAVFRCDERAQEYLSREIWGRFYRFSRSLGFYPPSPKDAVTEFDSYLIEREYGIVGREPKRWKNVIWKILEETSQDAPLKVINGKLLGRNGVLWDVFRRWRKANGTGHVSINDEDPKELGDWDATYTLQREEDRELQNRLLSVLDFREKIALLALWFKISLDDSCVRKAMQIGKDACYRAKASLCEKLRVLKAEDNHIQEPDFMNAFIAVLKEELKSENSVASLLDKIEVNSKN